jgi:hypothetical protein
MRMAVRGPTWKRPDGKTSSEKRNLPASLCHAGAMRFTRKPYNLYELTPAGLAFCPDEGEPAKR